MKCVCHEHKPKRDCLKASDFEPPEETARGRFWLWLAWLVVAAAVLVIGLGRAKAEDVPPERWCAVYKLHVEGRAPMAYPRATGRDAYTLTSPTADRICAAVEKERAARKAAPQLSEVP